jgi:serine/threonine protein kinase
VSCYGHFPDDQNAAIAMEFVRNGSLANHLPDGQTGDFCELREPTRIVKIICGIVIAMDWMHSQNITHRDLTPENIVVDWDWNIRIIDFGQSDSPTEPRIPRLPGLEWVPSVNCHYAAPETYENIVDPGNDVFSFGMILYELVVGHPMYPKTMDSMVITGKMIQEDWQPQIPNCVLPETGKLICDCLSVKYWERPSFSEILKSLKRMRFKLIGGVNSSKVEDFVNQMNVHEIDTATEERII